MSLDPLSGLDPAAPATTLTKLSLQIFSPSTVVPAPTPGSTGSPPATNAGGRPIAEQTFIVVNADGTTRVITYAEFIQYGGGF